MAAHDHPIYDYTVRDTAVRAESMIDQHIADCTQYRINVQNTLAEIRSDLKGVSWKLALLLGGLEAASKGIDFYVPIIHKATGG